MTTAYPRGRSPIAGSKSLGDALRRAQRARWNRAAVLLLAIALTAGIAPAAPTPAAPTPAEPASEAPAPGANIAADLLVSPGRIFAGKESVEALVIDPEVRTLVFLVDGEELGRRSKPPWKAKLSFAEPARAQVVTLRALGKKDRLMSEVSREVNRFRRRFRIRLQQVSQVDGGVQVEGAVTIPADAELDRLELTLSGTEATNLATRAGAGKQAFSSLLPADPSSLGVDAFVTARAYLGDGRVVEDVGLIGQDVASVDVQLVQLQVLVNRKNGPPVRDLRAEDFRIREGGQERQVEGLTVAEEAPLHLGLVIDSSGSMIEIWPSVQAAVRSFLDHAVGDDDRVFLVDFDTHVRLVRPLGEPGEAAIRAVEEGLGEIEPEGFTALYDSVGFSILRFLANSSPGTSKATIGERRALVVITDGADLGSHIDPKEAVELGVEHGIPVYVVSIPQLSAARGSGGRQMLGQGAANADLRLLTDPTGGRLLRAGSANSLDRAFAQIAAELRSQLVLTFLTDNDPEELRPGRVVVEIPGRQDLEIRAVMPLDLVR